MNNFEKAKIIAEIFQAVCVGIGALLGGLGALKVLGEWRDKRRKISNKKKWLKRFPKALLGKDFKLLRLSYTKNTGGTVIGSSDNVYVCDSRTKTRHWVTNEISLQALGFNQEEVEGATKGELEAYKVGEHIDLGELS